MSANIDPALHLVEESPVAPSISYRKVTGNHRLSYWLVLPKSSVSYGTPLIALHGIKRRARIQVEKYASYAQALGRPVIAPIFSDEAWPRYQQVVRGGRADLALFGMLSGLRTAGIWQTDKIDLAGFSGGAQFVHRFAMLYPETIGRLIVSSAGWFTFPDAHTFPYGFGARNDHQNWGPFMQTNLARFLGLSIAVTVGEYDCKKDSHTRSGTKIDAQQGVHRLERAQRWVTALHEVAAKQGLPQPDATLHVLPRCGHGFAECVKKGRLTDLVFNGAVSMSDNKKAFSAPPNAQI